MKNKPGKTGKTGKPIKSGSPDETAGGSPVFRTAKSILKLLQNKIIASLMLLGQGVLFLVSPSGDMKPTIRISAGLIILVALIVIFLHLIHTRKRNALDIAIGVFNGLLIPAAVFCLVSPQSVEPFVRFAVGIVTIVTGLLNLVETLKIKNRKDWKFVVSVIGAVAVMGLGIVMAAARVEDVAVTQRVIGIFLALNGLANIWYALQLRRKMKEERRARKDESKTKHKRS